MSDDPEAWVMLTPENYIEWRNDLRDGINSWAGKYILLFNCWIDYIKQSGMVCDRFRKYFVVRSVIKLDSNGCSDTSSPSSAAPPKRSHIWDGRFWYCSIIVCCVLCAFSYFALRPTNCSPNEFLPIRLQGRCFDETHLIPSGLPCQPYISHLMLAEEYECSSLNTYPPNANSYLSCRLLGLWDFKLSNGTFRKDFKFDAAYLFNRLFLASALLLLSLSSFILIP